MIADLSTSIEQDYFFQHFFNIILVMLFNHNPLYLILSLMRKCYILIYIKFIYIIRYLTIITKHNDFSKFFLTIIYIILLLLLSIVINVQFNMEKYLGLKSIFVYIYYIKYTAL